MKIWVKLLSGKTILLYANPGDTLKEFKEQILEILGLPSDSYRLCSFPCPMDDDTKTLEEMEFTGLHDYNVHLVPREPIDVLVKTLTGG